MYFASSMQNTQHSTNAKLLIRVSNFVLIPCSPQHEKRIHLSSHITAYENSIQPPPVRIQAPGAHLRAVAETGLRACQNDNQHPDTCSACALAAINHCGGILPLRNAHTRSACRSLCSHTFVKCLQCHIIFSTKHRRD
jgi:hypothetical protein